MGFNVKYKQNILNSFEKLKFTPRDSQLENINEILTAYLDNKFKYVVFNASAGAGKSIIGAVVADVLATIKGATLASQILMHNNVLTNQYHRTFSSFGKNEYLLIKGASNYKCNVLSDESFEDITAENCVITQLKNKKQTETIQSKCSKCEYLTTKLYKNKSRNVITNFSYYFIDRQFSNTMESRLITIFDEAHTLSESFCEFAAIYLSNSRIDRYIQDITAIGPPNALALISRMKEFSSIIQQKKVDDSNYIELLVKLQRLYNDISQSAMILAQANESDFTKFVKFSKIQKKFAGFASKIDDFLKHKYEHVFEFKEKELEFSIKPIFIGDMFEKTLANSEFIMFMSATISKEYVVETLALDETKVKFIKAKPAIPPENKQIVFFDTQTLNYQTMQDKKTVNLLCENTTMIVNAHTKEKENGIILTPSFDICEKLAKYIQDNVKGVKIFQHMRGMKSDHLLMEFKKEKETSVLISPSIYEGVDLPGDLSRYQIIVKAPFPSLADKRMKYIADRHSTIYRLITIKKIVQGAGRSVRGPDDFAVVYILDSMAKNLFMSKLNVWKDEFTISEVKS